MIVGAVLLLALGASAKPPAGLLGDPHVLNDPSNPVPVYVLGGAQEERIRLQLIGGGTTSSDYEVPEGKMLLIDWVSVHVLTTDMVDAQASLTTFGLTTPIQSYALGSVDRLSTSLTRLSLARAGSWWLRGGEMVEASVQFSDSMASGTMILDVTGRLIDEPENTVIRCTNNDPCEVY